MTRLVRLFTKSRDGYTYEDLTDTPFKLQNGCRVTLFQDAHCDPDFPPKIMTDYGQPDTSYIPPSCFEQIYEAIVKAKRFVYITGWSVDTKITLTRRKLICQEEVGHDKHMTIAELLAFKAAQGVKCYLHIWDEALSVNIAGVDLLSGIMGTCDEETNLVCAKIPGVECQLSYRTGTQKENQFLWTHHQKTVIVDADPLPGSYSNSNPNLFSSGNISSSGNYSNPNLYSGGNTPSPYYNSPSPYPLSPQSSSSSFNATDPNQYTSSTRSIDSDPNQYQPSTAGYPQQPAGGYQPNQPAAYQTPPPSAYPQAPSSNYQQSYSTPPSSAPYQDYTSQYQQPPPVAQGYSAPPAAYPGAYPSSGAYQQPSPSGYSTPPQLPAATYPSAYPSTGYQDYSTSQYPPQQQPYQSGYPQQQQQPPPNTGYATNYATPPVGGYQDYTSQYQQPPPSPQQPYAQQPGYQQPYPSPGAYSTPPPQPAYPTAGGYQDYAAQYQQSPTQQHHQLQQQASSYFQQAPGAGGATGYQAGEENYSIPDKDGHRYAVTSFMTCEHKFIKMWDDRGTLVVPHPVSIFRPDPPKGWYILGDLAQRHHQPIPDPLTRVMVVRDPPPHPNFPPVLAPPDDFIQVWPNRGVFQSKAGGLTIWRPIPPKDYEALGYVTSYSSEPPSKDIIRCVHHSALEPAHAVAEEDHRPIWKNGAKLRNTATGGPKVSIWSIKPKTAGLICGTWVLRSGFKISKEEADAYWTLRDPPLGIEPTEKPGDIILPKKKASVHLEHLEQIQLDDIGKRRVIAFVGGLDLTFGRWDTPSHPLYRTLHNEHKSDYLHGWLLDRTFGPREPWHDIHGKFEGPIARDIMTNFEQRWRKQGKTHLPHFLNKEFISIKEEEINTPDSWSCRLCRSIDPFSADIPLKENGIQKAYITAIRNAKRFIYMENQYFMGSAEHWLTDRNVKCLNLIPFEIADRIAMSIVDDQPIVAYILLPLYPEGYPATAPIQEQLRWQWNTMCMMYDHIAFTLQGKSNFNGSRDPADYLIFLCVGQREMPEHSTAERKDPKVGSKEYVLSLSRRVPIYVHSKLMIVDDEYIILGSANINERSMAGDRDSEICVEAWQSFAKDVDKPRGGVHKFRMSVWAEHTAESVPEYLYPNSPHCVSRIRGLSEHNWNVFTGPDNVDMTSHLMRYPIRIDFQGKVTADPECFPDTVAPVMGKPSLAIVDALTC